MGDAASGGSTWIEMVSSDNEISGELNKKEKGFRPLFQIFQTPPPPGGKLIILGERRLGGTG